MGSMHRFRYVVNCSMLFTELPLLERPSAAKAAGFDSVEFWWPFNEPVPARGQVDAFIEAIEGAGVHLAGLNFFAGDLAGPDCGVLSIPDRSSDFVENVEVAVAIGERLGVEVFNALYGNRVETSSPEAQDELALENLVHAAGAAGRIGATVLIEAVSGPKPYPVRTAADAVRVVDQVRELGAANIGFLCDLYHLAANGDDVQAAIALYAAKISHVQIASYPGRGQPGTGELDIAGHLAELGRLGYRGRVGLEYKATVKTADSFAWVEGEGY